ncbi:MAG TPA: T9SS type A sorting domain-containing protein [Cyclobacteriaceae bacterium]|jgi:hypothetical protein|nr:T9SS type A sorting domain-containing protein [Cyclobacteriaceae bacterium]
MNKYFLFFLFIISCLYLNANGQTVTYEAENGTLVNGADKQNCNACSGMYQVGYLGGNKNGACVFQINNSAAGNFVLSLTYSSADQRSLFITINNEPGIEVVCTPSGGWQTPATKNVEIDLTEGLNTIRFDNSHDWAPNLDRFTLTPGEHYTMSGFITFENNPLKNVSVNLTGGSTRSVVTDDNGYYVFNDLPANRDYVVTPQSTGKVFSPVYHHVEALSSDQTSESFLALVDDGAGKKSFDFGQNGKLIYNTQTGMTTVSVNGNEIIRNAYAAVSSNGKMLTSMDYSNRSVSFNDIVDDFGTGKKVTVWLTGNNLPQMQQTFYLYIDRKYFLSEVSISGDAINTNYMAPLISNNVSIDNMGEDPNVLSLPFDNDTFIRYSSQSLRKLSTVTSSEVTAYYDNMTREGLVLGSVEHMSWKTGVRLRGIKSSLSALEVWGGFTDVNVTRDQLPHGYLSGKTVKSPKIFVGLFDDWREGLDEYGKANAIAEPRYIFDWKKPTPVGWNSWGVIQAGLSLAKAKSVVQFFAKDLPTFRVDNIAYIDLDSFWDNMVQGGLEGDFSNLTVFANYCKASGLKPGIYWGPFVDWGKYDRKVEGSNYNYAETWTQVHGAYHDLDGGRAMDPTHPATQERIKYVIGKFKSCGFEMIKIDFLGHASVESDHFYDATVTTGMQAYRKGMEYLVNQLDGKMLVYAAISPNLATGRYAHMRRIACDAFSDINATEYTLNSTTYGWWQTYLYNYIDADHVVFNQQSAGENRARFTSAVINGTIITGDDFSTSGQWTNRAKDFLQRQDILNIVKDGKSFKPVEGGSSAASEMFEKEVGDDYYLALLNYSNQKSVEVKLNRLKLNGTSYSVKELFSGSNYSIQNASVTVSVGTKDAAILKFSKSIVNGINSDPPKDTVFFYPNPASKQVKICSSEQIVSVKLLAMNGSTVMEFKNIYQDSYFLDLSKQSAGNYIICIKDSLGNIKNYRIVKE